jgi:hypothetical protein
VTSVAQCGSPERPLIVEFVGPFGAGKSALCRRSADALKQMGIPVFVAGTLSIPRLSRVLTQRSWNRRTKAAIRASVGALTQAALEPGIAGQYLGLLTQGAAWPCDELCGTQHPRFSHLLDGFQYTAASRRRLRGFAAGNEIPMVHAGGFLRTAALQMAFGRPTQGPAEAVAAALDEGWTGMYVAVLVECSDTLLLTKRILARDRARGRPSELGRIVEARPEVFRNRVDFEALFCQGIREAATARANLSVIVVQNDGTQPIGKLAQDIAVAISHEWERAATAP